jgi:replication initiation protein RepC
MQNALDYKKARRRGRELNPQTPIATERTYPLGMVLSTCPDIVDYAKGWIANRRDFQP